MQQDPQTHWRPWVVCRDAGFEVVVDVDSTEGAAAVPLVQIDAKQFIVGRRFRFRNPAVAERLVSQLAKLSVFDSDDERRAAVAVASDYEPDDGFTDLASIPPFLRWFVNNYGTHTLAAIIHDRLIEGTANTGALRSDVVADRFFREMLHACGTPAVKRWVMWTAVALRTRWKAGGWTQVLVILWALLGALATGGTTWLLANAQVLAAVAFTVVTLVPAGLLWGRQWGAAVVAAIALPLVAPAAALVLVARSGFWLLDQVTTRFDTPIPPPPPPSASLRSAGG